jgi:hypothetical protein
MINTQSRGEIFNHLERPIRVIINDKNKGCFRIPFDVKEEARMMKNRIANLGYPPSPPTCNAQNRP